MLTLAGWGLLDRRLSRRTRARLLVLSPLIYGACGGGAASGRRTAIRCSAPRRASAAAATSRARASASGRTRSSLIASHPWLGVGFGDFNFAWTLTPFPGRPVAFFDHTHNLVLNFAVELGVPLARSCSRCMVYALWRALAQRDRRRPRAGARRYPVQRAAFVMVFLVAVHSMLEYPLWYAYFLLPTAFAFGLCLERPGGERGRRRAASAGAGNARGPTRWRRCC